VDQNVVWQDLIDVSAAVEAAQFLRPANNLFARPSTLITCNPDNNMILIRRYANGAGEDGRTNGLTKQH